MLIYISDNESDHLKKYYWMEIHKVLSWSRTRATEFSKDRKYDSNKIVIN